MTTTTDRPSAPGLRSGRHCAPSLTVPAPSSPVVTEMAVTDRGVIEPGVTEPDVTAAGVTAAAVRLTVPTAAPETSAPGPLPAPVPEADAAVRRSALPDGVVRQLLHSAVAVQAEDLLRALGALAVAAHRSAGTAAPVDWISWVERDVRDLGELARTALAAGASLPAGLDVGGGDPERPETVVEALLAGHEEVLRVLRTLAEVGDHEAWHDVVSRIVARREAEAVALRVTVGVGTPRRPDVTHVGRAPDRYFSPDLLV